MPRPTVLGKKDIEQVFDGAAASYDRVGPNIFAQFGKRLVERIPMSPGLTVLDVAAGKGAVLIPAANRIGPRGHVVGVDLSAMILEEAGRQVAAAGLANVELRRMDAEHLEFPDASFDVVTCAFALFMFPDMEAALREMYRVCKPDGYVAVTYFGDKPPPFDPGWPLFARLCTAYQVGMRMPQKLGLTPEELESRLRMAGFRIIDTHTEVNDIVYATGEEWWDFMMTLGSRATILGMNDDVRRRFKDEYLARLLPDVAIRWPSHGDGRNLLAGQTLKKAGRPRRPRASTAALTAGGLSPSQVKLPRVQLDQFQNIDPGRLAGHEHGGRRDLVGGHPGFLLHFRWKPLMEDLPGMQNTASDAVIAALKGRRMGQTGQAELGRAVGGVVGANTLGRNAADIDYQPAPLLLHDAEGGAGAQEWRPKVGGDQPVPGLGGHLVNGGGSEDPGVIDQDIQPGETLHCPGKKRVDILFSSHVCGYVFRLDTQGDDRLAHGLQRRRVLVGEDEVSSLLCQTDGDGLADAAG